MSAQLVSSMLAIILVAGLLGPVAQAAPFYYYFADDAAAAPAPTGVADQAKDAAGQAQQAASQAKDSIKDTMQQAQDKVASATGSSAGEAPIRERITGHMSDLYSHGSSAMKGLVHTVEPDIKNIGKDLTEVYEQTRTQMGKRIEPLAHTVRPYIDQAQKAVAPYVSKAREEVPKAMSKVSTAVWSKIQGSGHQGQEGQTVGEQVQHATNSIQKEADKAAGEAANSAQQQQQQQENKQ